MKYGTESFFSYLLSLQLFKIIAEKVHPQILNNYLNSTHSLIYDDRQMKDLITKKDLEAMLQVVEEMETLYRNKSKT